MKSINLVHLTGQTQFIKLNGKASKFFYENSYFNECDMQRKKARERERKIRDNNCLNIKSEHETEAHWKCETDVRIFLVCYFLLVLLLTKINTIIIAWVWLREKDRIDGWSEWQEDP